MSAFSFGIAAAVVTIGCGIGLACLGRREGVLRLRRDPSVARRGAEGSPRLRRTRITTRGLVVLAGTLLVLTPAGCGSSDTDESADASPTAAWVDGFCSSLTTWKGSVESVGETLKNTDELSRAKIEGAADDIANANETLAADMDDLGAPPKTAVPEAQDAVAGLRSEVEKSASQISQATESISSATGLLTAVNIASTALLTLSSEISGTVATLESLDAADEWKQAFADSDECDSLGKS